MRVFDSNILIYHLNEVLPPEVFTSVELWISRSANACNWGERGGRGMRLTPASSMRCFKAAQN